MTTRYRAASALLGLAVLLFSPTVLAQRPAWTRSLSLKNAPFQHPHTPSVVVHAPAGFRADKPFDLIVFLHGWNSCARAIVDGGAQRCSDRSPLRPGQNLAAVHDAAGTNSLLVVPQLALLERTGHPGRFSERGVFSAFLDELLTAVKRPELVARGGMHRPRSVTLVAHSAGYQAALAILEKNDLSRSPVNIVLFDALYDAPRIFADRFLDQHCDTCRLISLYTGQRTTKRHNLALAAYLRDKLPQSACTFELGRDPELAYRNHRAVVAHTSIAHGAIPFRQLSSVLRSLDLARR